MAEHEEKKLHSEQAADDIRVNELVKVTQKEARDSAHDPLRDIPVENRNYWRFRHGDGREGLPRGIKWGITGLLVIFMAGFAVSYYVVKKQVAATVSSQVGTFAAGVSDLQNLDPQAAAQKFSSLGSTTSSAGVWTTLASLFGGAGGAIKSFTDLSGQLALLSGEMGAIENDAFAFVAQNGTSTLAADLSAAQGTLAAIDADSSALSGAAAYFGPSSPLGGGSYFSLKAQAEGAETFLGAFVPWLSDASTTHHMLVLFQNPSEMRPGGGFLGSYADVSIRGGAIAGVAVHDIADVDKGFAQKIVPPVPLQLEETAWRPADGNWFFDFPTSASETIAMFEASKLYVASGTTFDGAIAVTPQVIGDLLSVTGPVTVPGAGPKTASTTFTADNFVEQVQKIVQAGQAGTAGGNATYPKEVIAQLYPAIFAQLASSTDAERQQLLGLALDWIANKDVMAYFKNSAFETFASAYGADGAAYELPQNFNGDYLAIANADVNSDKSERYVDQAVNYAATIGADGTLTVSTIVTRAHHGNQSPYWWYKTTNTDYLQVFVPPGTSLENESGGIAKTVPAPINYARSGYGTDPFVLAIASTTLRNFTYPKLTTNAEGDKQVFAVWTRTYAGSSSTVALDYTRRLYIPPAPGVQYQFVFERPSGAGGEYKIEVDAPLGYSFAENGLATFTYDSSSTPGRLTFPLTLQKLQD